MHAMLHAPVGHSMHMLFAHGTHAPPTTAPRSSRRGECAMDDAAAIN